MHNPDTLEKFLKIIDKEASRLKKILDGLLKLSLLESEEHNFRFSSLDICKMMNEIISSVENQVDKADLILKADIPPREIKVLGDPDLLPQVFLNLIGNAVKYTSTEGTIKISLIEDFKSASE